MSVEYPTAFHSPEKSHDNGDDAQKSTYPLSSRPNIIEIQSPISRLSLRNPLDKQQRQYYEALQGRVVAKLQQVVPTFSVATANTET